MCVHTQVYTHIRHVCLVCVHVYTHIYILLTVYISMKFLILINKITWHRINTRNLRAEFSI